MITTSQLPRFSPRAKEAFSTATLRVRIFATAQLLWDRLSDEDRARLGDLEAAWRERGTAGIYQFLKGVPYPRAVIEVAFVTGHIDSGTRSWLLAEIGEVFSDSLRTLDEAIAAGHLVLVETPRAAYWHGDRIEIDWEKNGSLWEFFWVLCERSKRSLRMTHFDRGEKVSRSAVSTCKERLVNDANFPEDLAIRVDVKRGQGYQLELPPEEIRIFLVEEHDVVTEWIGTASPLAAMLAGPNA